FDGFDGSGFPIFTAHLAQSTNHAASFSDTPLLTFSSPSKDNGNTRQRVLGDYQQMKAVGPTFYGTFTANGVAFGRATPNGDPIFFEVPTKVRPTVTSIAPSALARGSAHVKATISGKNFEPGATASISGTNVTVTSTTFVSPTRLTVKITV